MQQAQLEQIRTHLQRYRNRANSSPTNADETATADLIEQVRLEAVRHGDQSMAKRAWCFHAVLQAQQHYHLAWQAIRGGRFYDGWCEFDRADIQLAFLRRHMALTDEFGLDTIERQIPIFQKLYPYSLFMSPAFVEKERRCTICDAVVGICNRCAHSLGEIYDGVMCSHKITIAELLELSLVKNPVQKYSVPFTTDPKTGEQVDHYDYSAIAYVANGLRSPYDRWAITETTSRHPHSRYKHVGRNARCPCGSGKRYKACCLPESGVLRPHFEIAFSVPPPSSLPEVAYTRNR